MTGGSPTGNYVERLFGACLMLLGCAIVLTLAVCLLTEIWPWIVGICLLIGGAAIAIRAAANGRRKW